MIHRVRVTQWVLAEFTVIVAADSAPQAENAAIDQVKTWTMTDARVQLSGVIQGGEVFDAKATAFGDYS